MKIQINLIYRFRHNVPLQREMLFSLTMKPKEKIMGDKKKKDKKSEEECVWLLGTEHGGSVSKQLMFDKQLEVPICEEHFKQHRRIMLLVANGYDIEEVVEMDMEEVSRLAITLELSGIGLEGGKY